MDLKEQFYNKYFEIVKEIEKRVTELSFYYEKYMECKLKCENKSACCDANIRLFPVEIQAIKYKMENDGFDKSKIKISKNNRCKFLRKSICQVYKYRPIICRIWGVPYLDQDKITLPDCGMKMINRIQEDNLEIKYIDGVKLFDSLAQLNIEFITSFPDCQLITYDNFILFG